MSNLSLLGITVMRVLAIAALLMWGLVVADVARQVGQPFPGFRCEEGMSVSPQTNPAWNGPRAGLAAYDYLLSANGKALVRVGELKAIVASVPPGTPITYEVWRAGERVTVQVPTQVLSGLDALVGFGPVLAVGLLHMLIGMFACWQRPGHVTGQAHLLFTLVVGLAFQTLGVDFTLTHRFGAFYQSVVHLAGSVMLHLALVFPEPRAWLRGRMGLLTLLYAPSVTLGVVQAATYDPVGLAVRGTHVTGPHYDWLFLGWGLWSLVGLLGLLLSIGWTAWRGESAAIRQQGRLVLVGAVLAFGPGALIYLLPTLAGQTTALSMPLVIASQACLAFFPLSIAFAIVRHRLFEIDVLIKRSLAYSLALAALFGLYGAVLFTSGWLLHGPTATATGMAALAAGLACVPVMQATRRLLDKTFFRAPYDFQAVTTRFAEETRSLPRIDALMACLGRVLTSALHPEWLVVLEDLGAGGVGVAHAQGGEAPDLTTAAFQQAVARALWHGPADRPVLVAWAGQTLLVAPVAAPGERLGLLVLGPRKSELAYSEPDRHLVGHLAQQLAVRWQNGRFFDQLLRHNEELAHANAELRKLDELKRQFLNAVSHELRTPLSSIIGFGEFLKEQVGGPLPPIQQEFVHHITTGARRLQGLVDDLLDYAQVEAGAFRIEPRWSDAREAVANVVLSLRPLADDNGLTLETALPEDPVEGEFDPVRIEQVLFNLVGNAIKFTPKGGKVTVSAALKAGELRLTVTDTGVGIPEEALAKLFDKFYQVDPSTTRRYGGTGLGLAIAKAIVEAHRGAIAVQSVPNEGSTFAVTLPVPPDEDEPEVMRPPVEADAG